MASNDKKKPTSGGKTSGEGQRFSQVEKAAYGDDALHSIHRQLAREKEEPSEGFSPIPVFLLFIFGGLIFWSGIYPDWKPSAGGDLSAQAWDPIRRGERLYRNNCAMCHQAEGQGVPGAFPPLDSSPWVVGSEQRLVKILLRGLEGPVTVLGNEYNGSMPSYGDNGLGWSDRDIHAIATYVRQSWNNDAPPVTEEVVAAVRAEISGKSGSYSAAELLGAHPME
jgi:mono/diheme cytochrome c family protein